MERIDEAWVVATRESSAPGLTAGARQLARRVLLYYIGGESVVADADEACRLVAPAGAPAGCCGERIAAEAAGRQPALVLVEDTADGRMMAASIAVACGAAVFSAARSIRVRDGAVLVERMVHGGAAIQVEKALGAAIVTVDAGSYEARDAVAVAAVREIACAPPPGLSVLSREPRAATAVDLSQEAVVVGVGRGMGGAEGVPAVRAFAAAIGAGIGCSRPVGEEERWFGDTGYLGISGDAIRPDVYIACGISGQVQHMVGVNGAGTIFAINKDPKATIFGECDYGIVADMNELIPVLTERFERLS